MLIDLSPTMMAAGFVATGPDLEAQRAWPIAIKTSTPGNWLTKSG
jgi:hypothetical protein